LLSGVALISPEETLLRSAEAILPSTVATLDAIHLATAVRLAQAGELDAILTFDRRLAEGARKHNLAVLSPS
jgi:predicted nucleic acid-binding protein